jgi:hypothetical protein
MTETLNVDEITARLTEIEAERDALLSKLQQAHAEIAAVLSCYPAVSPKTAETPAPKKRGRPRKVKPAEAATPDASGS